MNKIIATGIKLAEDPANKDVKVFTHKDIVELLRKEKKRACWSCHRCNCFLKQTASQKLKMTKQYFGECKGKQATFEDLKNLAPEAKTAQVNIPVFTDSDSENESFNNTFNVMNVMRETTEAANEFGFQEYMVGIESAITDINIPDFNELSKTEFVKDKYCAICMKKDMDLEHLSRHLTLVHSISFVGEEWDDHKEEWIEMAQYWIDSGHTSPHVSSNEAAEYYSGEDQKLYSDEEQVPTTSP